MTHFRSYSDWFGQRVARFALGLVATRQNNESQGASKIDQKIQRTAQTQNNWTDILAVPPDKVLLLYPTSMKPVLEHHIEMKMTGAEVHGHFHLDVMF